MLVRPPVRTLSRVTVLWVGLAIQAMESLSSATPPAAAVSGNRQVVSVGGCPLANPKTVSAAESPPEAASKVPKAAIPTGVAPLGGTGTDVT
jgi:hypothetical protein